MKNIIQYKNKMECTKSEKCFVRKQEMYTSTERKELEKLVNKYKLRQRAEEFRR